MEQKQMEGVVKVLKTTEDPLSKSKSHCMWLGVIQKQRTLQGQAMRVSVRYAALWQNALSTLQLEGSQVQVHQEVFGKSQNL